MLEKTKFYIAVAYQLAIGELFLMGVVTLLHSMTS